MKPPYVSWNRRANLSGEKPHFTGKHTRRS
jgi:hypothetical protein